MAMVEFSGIVYTLTDDQTKLLAERLRNYARGTFPDDVKRVTELSGNPNWADGALATADFLEEILVDNLDGPLPLEGKAAEATFWTLRIMCGLGRIDRTDRPGRAPGRARRIVRRRGSPPGGVGRGAFAPWLSTLGPRPDRRAAR